MEKEKFHILAIDEKTCKLIGKETFEVGITSFENAFAIVKDHIRIGEWPEGTSLLLSYI